MEHTNWRVVAQDAALNTGASAPNTFTVDTGTPSGPVLVSPETGDALNSRTVFFRWDLSASGDVVAQFLQVTSGDTFNPHLDVNKLLGPLVTGDQVLLSADGVYNWRVVARDAALNTGASDTRTFTVDTADPAPPFLVSPATGDFLNTRTVPFEWDLSASGDVVAQFLQVSSGDTSVVDKQLGATVTGDQVILSADGVYNWHVVARDAALNTGASVPNIFTVDIVAPGPPVLVFPVTGDRLNTRTIDFKWELSGSGDVVSQVLQVTSGDTFNPHLDVDKPLGPLVTGDQVLLSADGVYNWRVVARDAALNTGASETNTFAVDIVPPGAPTLLLTRSGDRISDNTPRFVWKPPVENLVKEYRLQVTSGDINTGPFDISKIFPAAITADQTTSPLADATYRWRVIAVDAAQNSSASDTQTFTVDTVAPAAPVLDSPDSGDSLIPPFNLDWSDVTDPSTPVTYSLVVDDDISFGSPEINASDLTKSQFTIASGALADNLYHWQVTAKDGVGNTADSLVQTFRVDTQTDPPTLLLPRDGAIIGTRTPSFEWDHSDLNIPVGYELRVISVDGTFDRTFPTQQNLSLTLPSALPLGPGNTGDFTWRVKAIDFLGNDRTSIIRTFTVNLNRPVAPAIKEPEDKSAGISVNPVFKWEGVALANFYDLEIATGDFVTTTVPITKQIEHIGDDPSTIQSLPLFAPTLASSTLYQWHVRGRTKSGDDPRIGLFSTADFITAGGRVGVTLKVSLEGTGTADDPVTFDVNLYDKGVFGPATADKPWLIFEKSAVRTFKGVTGDRADRTFTLLLTDVDPRFYDITIETNHTLVNLRDDVGVAQNTGTVDMGTLLEGNAIDDPSVEPASIINALDASLLAAAINEQKFDPRVDFNRDGKVDNADLELLKKNYLRFSPFIIG